MLKLSRIQTIINKKLLYFAFLRLFGFKTQKLAIALHYYTPKKN